MILFIFFVSIIEDKKSNGTYKGALPKAVIVNCYDANFTGVRLQVYNKIHNGSKKYVNRS
jgi:hypothetical protein